MSGSKSLRQLFAVSLFLLLAAPASAETFAIELKPRTSRQGSSRAPAKGLSLEERLSKVAGRAAENGLETIKALGENAAPVNKGTPVVTGKKKSSESGTPGLEGVGKLPRGGNVPPNVLNNPAVPPPPKPPKPPQICQMLLNLLQQAANQQQQQQNGGEQSANGGNQNPGNQTPTGQNPGGQKPGNQVPGGAPAPAPAPNPGNIFTPPGGGGFCPPSAPS